MGHSVGGGTSHVGRSSQCRLRHSVQQSIWVCFVCLRCTAHYIRLVCAIMNCPRNYCKYVRKIVHGIYKINNDYVLQLQ